MAAVSQGFRWQTIKQWGLKKVPFLMLPLSNGRICSLRPELLLLGTLSCKWTLHRWPCPVQRQHQPWVNCVCWPWQILVTAITVTERLHACMQASNMKLLHIPSFEDREGLPRQGRTQETLSLDFMSLVLSYEFLLLFNVKKQIEPWKDGGEGI